jgi:eukaryotic-like serine/threonine-protein kinase
VKLDDQGRPIGYPERMPLAPGTRIDDLELIEHLADGGGAEIHRAVQHPSGRVVAVKVPHESALTDPRRARAWRREAALTRLLDHDRLVRRVDPDRFRSQPYLVFEYVGGGNLREWMAQGELPVAQIVEWGAQIAEGLDYLHRRGLVYGDLKPENLLVTDDLDLKLADFGAVTKMRRSPLRVPREILEVAEGTPDYMSPEQIQGGDLDARSDVYAWGVVSYELLTGGCPFAGADAIAVMEAHLREHPVAIRDLRPAVPPSLEAVVMTAMRRAPTQRQPDMQTVIDELAHLDDIDVGTRDRSPERTVDLQPLGGSARLWRFVGAVALCWLALIATILGILALVR